MAKSSKNSLQRRLETGLARLGVRFMQALPHRTAQRLGGRVGLLAHDLIGIRRKHAIAELLRCFPDRDEAWARTIVRKLYRHFGILTAELARNPQVVKDHREWIEIDPVSLGHLKRAQESGRGTFITSGHHGNWEYAGVAAVVSGFPTTFVVGEQSNPDIEKLLDDLRRAGGLHIVKRKDAARGIPRALKANHLVAMMIDQDARRAGIFIPFFGRPASTFRGVGVFTLKYNPHVMFMRTWRDDSGVIRVRVDPVDVPNTGDTEADIRTLMTDLTDRLEAHIREYPDQYLWLHKRWKTKPPDEASEALP